MRAYYNSNERGR